MALRLSAKRVAATLRAGNVSPVVNGFVRRNASQATAATASLPDEIHVCYDILGHDTID